MRVVLTRPRRQAHAFAEALAARFGDRFEPVFAPIMEILPLPVEVDFTAFDAVVFTSQNGVVSYEALGGPKNLPAYCVGDQTAEAAKALGLSAISANGDVEALNALLQEQASGQRLLHVSGRHVAGRVEGAVTRVEAYDQRPLTPGKQLENLLISEVTLLVPLFSPNAARWFQNTLGDGVRARLIAICMSAAVSGHLDPKRFAQIVVCAHPTRDEMIAQIGRALESGP